MKKVLFAAVAVFAFSFANAQEEGESFGFSQGDVIVEGNLGFSSKNNKNTEIKENNFVFNPKAGYFLLDKLAVGVELNIGSSKEVNDALNTEEKASEFTAGVFARYYFLELGKRFKTYGEFGVGFGSEKSESTVAGTTVSDPDVNKINTGLGLGVNYFLTDNFAINFALSDVLSYSSRKVDVDGAKAVSEFNGNINVFNNFFTTATFGLTYKF